MRGLLTPLIQFQRFFIPILILLVLWGIWRTVAKKDFAVGLALYLSLVIVVDSFMNIGIYLPGLEKGSIRYSEVFALLLLSARPKEVPRQPPYGAVMGMVTIYFLMLFFSVFRADKLISAVFEFRNNIVPQIIAFSIAVRGLREREDYRRFFFALMGLVILVGLFNFWDVFFDRWILKSDMLDKAIYSHNRKLQRFGSLFLNPNYFGAFIVLVFPVTFVWALAEKRPWRRICAWTALLLLFFSLVQTQSRGSMLAFGVGMVLLVFGPNPSISRKRRVGLLALGCLVFMAVMPGFYERAVQRFGHMETETAEGQSRETTWAYSLQMIANHPILGIGFGEDQFSKTMVSYGFEQKFGVKALDAPHNSYLQIAVFAGIPALLIFLFANILLLSKAVSASLRANATPDAPLVFGLAVGVVGFLASIFPDLQLFTKNTGPAYWVFFALLLSLLTMPPQPSTSAAVDPSDPTAGDLRHPRARPMRLSHARLGGRK